jgi:hypothetical protein
LDELHTSRGELRGSMLATRSGTVQQRANAATKLTVTIGGLSCLSRTRSGPWGFPPALVPAVVIPDLDQ